MKLTNLQIITSLPALQALAAARIPSLKVRALYQIGRAQRLAEQARDDYVAAQQKLVETHCKRHGNGDPVWIQREDGVEVELPEGAASTGVYRIADMESYRKDSESLGAITVDLDIAPIGLADFGDAAGEALTGEIFARLDWFIQDVPAA